MFLAGIFIVVFFAVEQRDLSLVWMLMIGTLLGLSTLITFAKKSLGVDDEPEPKPEPPAPKKSKKVEKVASSLLEATDLEELTIEERLDVLFMLLRERETAQSDE